MDLEQIWSFYKQTLLQAAKQACEIYKATNTKKETNR